MYIVDVGKWKWLLTYNRFKEIIKVVKETSESTKEAMQTLCKI
jgi:hypothetical protein